MLTAQHPEWNDHKAQLERYIAEALAELLSPDTSPDRTNYVRGQIAAYQRLIDEAQRKEAPAPPSTRYT